jgi:hypothetical protein
VDLLDSFSANEKGKPIIDNPHSLIPPRWSQHGSKTASSYPTYQPTTYGRFFQDSFAPLWKSFPLNSSIRLILEPGKNSLRPVFEDSVEEEGQPNCQQLKITFLTNMN